MHNETQRRPRRTTICTSTTIKTRAFHPPVLCRVFFVVDTIHLHLSHPSFIHSFIQHPSIHPFGVDGVVSIGLSVFYARVCVCECVWRALHLAPSFGGLRDFMQNVKSLLPFITTQQTRAHTSHHLARAFTRHHHHPFFLLRRTEEHCAAQALRREMFSKLENGIQRTRTKVREKESERERLFGPFVAGGSVFGGVIHGFTQSRWVKTISFGYFFVCVRGSCSCSRWCGGSVLVHTASFSRPTNMFPSIPNQQGAYSKHHQTTQIGHYAAYTTIHTCRAHCRPKVSLTFGNYTQRTIHTPSGGLSRLCQSLFRNRAQGPSIQSPEIRDAIFSLV